MAEIGVFVGALSRYLLDHRRDIQLIMVDDWAPQDQQPSEYIATGDRHARQTAEECKYYRLGAKRRVHKYRDRVTIFPTRSVVAAGLIGDQSIDLVFLDADHSEQGLTEDIAAWRPKVKPGGWLGGHDFGNNSVNGVDFSGVKRAVTKWARNRYEIELDSDYTWFCKIQ